MYDERKTFCALYISIAVIFLVFYIFYWIFSDISVIISTNKGLVTVNTDNRTVSNTNLNKEYELLRKTFGFSDEDFLKFNLNAINCAFIGEDEKRLLREEILS